ncbi:MAG: hypothetical protein RL026_2825 [Pseudomonadota bacterium]|jgi:cytoskeletal protein CcmA (bactofilin family)
MDSNDNKGCLIVGEGVSIQGSIQLPGTIRINGTVEGTVEAREVLVGATGRITGKVSSDVADIHGQVRESLVVRERATVRSTGRVEGSFTYRSIAIEHGGVIEGRITHIDENRAPQTVDVKPEVPVLLPATTDVKQPN